MKILIVSQFFYPESFRINSLAETLKQKGHDVTVLTGQPNYPHGQIFENYGNWKRWRDEYQSIPILRVPVFPRKSGSALALLANYISFVVSACLFGLIRVQRPDVCLVWSSSPITSSLPAIFYRAITGVPVAIWVQDLWPESFSAVTHVRSPLILKPLTKLIKFIYRHCDQIWIQSEAFESSVVEHGGAKDKILYLPNWAEDFYDREAGAAVRDSENLQDFSILFAGNLGRAQSLSTVLEAAERLRSHRELRWYFVGDGSMKDWFAQEIQKRGLDSQIKILGSRTPQEMPALMKQAKVLFVSLGDDPTYNSTVPSKIQSYMASGKPILASMNGEGARLILKSKCGFVAAAEDANGLAEKVRLLLQLKDSDLAEMGDRAYQVFDSRFRMKKLTNQAEDYLSTLG